MRNFRKARFFIWVLFITVGAVGGFAFAKEEYKGAVTQGEFAKEFAGRMDLEVSKEAPPAESIKALETMGIKPTNGWNEEKAMTKQDLEKVLIEAGRLQAEVLAGKQMESVLKERGIIIPDEVNRRAVTDVLKDQNVNRLLQTPAISGPSIPYPKEGIGIIEKPAPRLEPLEVPPPEEPPPEEAATEPPPTEPPPPDVTTEPPRPSGGGS